MKILVTRPSDQAADTAARLSGLGHDCLVSPLLEIVPVAWELPDVRPDLVLITSANAFAGRIPAALLPVPVLAMGDASARAATAAGFAHVEAAKAKGAAALYTLAAARKPGRVLHLSGRDLTVADVPEGLDLQRVTTYRAEQRPLAADAERALREGGIDMTLLYSARTALQFADELQRIGVSRGDQDIALLGNLPGADFAQGWRSLVRAGTPDEEALFRAANLLHEGHSRA